MITFYAWVIECDRATAKQIKADYARICVEFYTKDCSLLTTELEIECAYEDEDYLTLITDVLKGKGYNVTLCDKALEVDKECIDDILEYPLKPINARVIDKNEQGDKI